MSEDVNKLIGRMLDRENELSPPAATFKGIHDYDEQWDDPGPEGIAAYEAYVDQFLGLLESAAVVTVIQAFTAAACIIGVMRMIRRVGSKYMRAISTPDDYFSLALLTVWFAFATLAAPNDTSGGEGVLLTYFWLTAFFLIYVPFSKISHYLYYPFTRYYFGKTMGYRGVYPVRRNPEAG